LLIDKPMLDYLRLLLMLLAANVLAAQTQKTSKELFEYIQEAKKLGLQEAEIRTNALHAGWDRMTIDQTYAIVRILDKEELRDGEIAKLRPLRALPEGYRIGPGDVLQVVVWKEPDASVPQVVVRPDGKISVPLIKEIQVAGLTPSELEQVLTAKLGKLINGADVTVIPRQIQSMKVYLVGAVKREGSLALNGPMTVLQAITEAGGVTDYAKRKKIYILRNDHGKQIRLPFDYEAVLRGEQIEQNIALKPDDTIVVPD
jgi:polysaccharide export outer membrane protein